MDANGQLLEALSHGNLGAAADALAAGGDANSAPDGFPLLCTGAGAGCIETVRLLKQYRADANAHDETGHTPIMWAATFCPKPTAVDILDELLSAGANINAKANDGATALDLAIHMKNDAAALWLHSHNAQGRKASVVAAENLSKNQSTRRP